MKIAPNYNYQPNYKQIKPSFKAIGRGGFRTINDKTEVIVYELGKEDIDLLKNFRQNIIKFYQKFAIKDESRQVISDEAFRAGIDILSDKGKVEDKAKVLLSVSDEGPCGIIIGNALKKAKNGTCWYSSRKNCAVDETEIDFLTTWSKKHKGIGKILLTEYLTRSRRDGFKSFYVRSELPECSFATTFYERNGFKELCGNKQKPTLKSDDHDYVSGHYFHDDDLVVPMKATAKNIDKIIKKHSAELKRKELTDDIHHDLSYKHSIEPSTVK